MRSQNRGQIRIIEAFLSIFVIFSAITVAANLATKTTAAENNGLASVGLQALLQLDSDGSLSAYMDAGNWSELRIALNLLLPIGVSFNLTVYDMEMRQVNTEIVSNGEFSSQEITLVRYICASQSSDFHYYVIYLYLAMTK